MLWSEEKVVVIGGGFAGLSAEKALSRQPVDVILIDRRNHHTFQPLLYQVAHRQEQKVMGCYGRFRALAEDFSFVLQK